MVTLHSQIDVNAYQVTCKTVNLLMNKCNPFMDEKQLTCSHAAKKCRSRFSRTKVARVA